MKRKITIIIFFILFFTTLLLYFYSSKISLLLIKNTKIESKKIAIKIISKNVSNDIIKELENKELFIVEKDNNNNIEMIDYDSKVVNELLSIVSKRITKNFNELEKKNNIVMKVPIGVVTNNIFLENLGPKIPIKLVLNGNVFTSLKTNVKEYGINSALIEVFVVVEVNINIIIPFRTSEIKVVNEIPISIKVVKGNVSSILNKE